MLSYEWKNYQPSEMPVAYSTDLRTRVIDAWDAEEGTQRQLAERFKVSLSFVKRVLRRYRTSAQREAKPRGATAGTDN